MTDTFVPRSRRAVLKGFATVVGSAILAACGDTSLPPATTSMAPTQNAASAMSVATTGATTAMSTAVPSQSGARKQGAIEYWHTNTDVLGGGAVQNIIQRFNDANPSIVLTGKPYPGYPELLQALQAAQAARIPPAVAQVGYGYLRYTVTNLPHTPVEDVIKRDPSSSDFLAKNYAPNVLELGRIDGVQHGTPLGFSVPVLFSNLDLLKQAGIESQPRTWDEVRDVSRAIKAKTGKFGVYLTESTDFFTQQAFIEGNGARVLIGSGNDVSCGVDSPEAVAAMQLAADLILKDGTAAHLPQAQGTQSFNSGQIAMYAASIATLNAIQKASTFQLGTTAFPTFGAKPRRIPVGGNDLFIFATDPAQQMAAWEWIKFIESPESLTTWVKGTGYLSPRLGVAEDPRFLKPYFDDNRLVKPATDELPEIVQWASWPGKNGLQANQELLDAREKILGGGDVASSLRDAAARVNQLIKQ